MSDELESVVEVAVEAGRLAASICSRVQREQTVSPVPESKVNNEPVTIADYASQAVILRALSVHYPEHEVLAEESSAHLVGQRDASVLGQVRQLVSAALDEEIAIDQLCRWIDHRGSHGARVRWAINPIDGTKGFLRGEQYVVAMGALVDDVPTVGILVCPNLPVDPQDPDGETGVLVTAIRGEGAHQTPLSGGPSRLLQASDEVDAERIRLIGSRARSHGDQSLLDALAAEAGFGGGIVRLDSQAKYVYLARGEAEIYVRPEIRPGWHDRVWDHVAGVTIASEAGTLSSDLDGQPLDFSCGKALDHNRGVLTSHGPLHGTIVEALGRVQAPS